jgi:hypothetical protein
MVISRRNLMISTIYVSEDRENGTLELRWGIYDAGLIADCFRIVKPGETAFGYTYEELRDHGEIEADTSKD